MYMYIRTIRTQFNVVRERSALNSCSIWEFETNAVRQFWPRVLRTRIICIWKWKCVLEAYARALYKLLYKFLWVDFLFYVYDVKYTTIWQNGWNDFKVHFMIHILYARLIQRKLNKIATAFIRHKIFSFDLYINWMRLQKISNVFELK